MVALVGVAVIHAGAWLVSATASPDSGLVPAAMAVARFCVPAFVFCSGLLLYRAYGRPAQPGAFLRRRWLRTLLPWLAWMPVFAAIDLVHRDLKPQAGDLAVWLAYGAGHLYFLLLIAQLYLLLLVMPRGRRGLLVFAAAALALQLGLDAYHTYGPLAPGALAWPLDYLPQVEAPFWAGYFVLGCLVASEYQALRSLWRLWPLGLILAGAGAILVLLEARYVGSDWWRQGSYGFLWPSRLPATLGLVLLLLWGGRLVAVRLEWLWPAIESVSRHSLGVYVLQALTLYQLGARTGSWPSPLRLPFLIAVSLGLAYGLVLLLTRTRWGALAVGEQPPPAPARRPVARASA